jgi:hypothetical protein
MSKKTKYVYDPTIRKEILASESVYDWESSLDDFITKLQKIKAAALTKDATFSEFNIHTESDSDGYACTFQIVGTRSENTEEKAFRLAQLEAQRKAEATSAADRKAGELAELKRLCKRLKVKSPI